MVNRLESIRRDAQTFAPITSGHVASTPPKRLFMSIIHDHARFIGASPERVRSLCPKATSVAATVFQVNAVRCLCAL